MNMQNVSNLTIPEGEVKTIHDKDDNLLWGRLAYDTKYAGDTFQQTYSGKNLLNGFTNQTSGGITSTWSANVVTLSGKSTSTYSNITGTDQIALKAGQTYTLSTATPTSLFRIQCRIRYSGNNYQYTIDKNGTNTSFSIPGDATSPVIRVLYIDGFTSGTDIDGVVKFQLELGSTATPYEPYTGGIPAPNPDYPQAVQVVTGEQTVTISDGINSESFPITLSKNLFDISTFVMGGMSSGQLTTLDYRITNITNPLEVEPNTKYTLSVTLGDSIKGFRLGVHQLDANKAFLSDSGWQQLVPNSYTFTTRADAKYIGIVCSCSTTSTTVSTGSTESQASYSVPSDWLRGSQVSVHNIDVDIELAEIGTSQDYIYKSGDDWYVHKETGKVTYNGSETWIVSNNSRYAIAKPSGWDTWGSNISTYPSKGYSTHLLPGDSGTVDNSFNVGGTNVFIRAPSKGTGLSNTATWKTWLTSNSLTIYSILATPNDTQITDATLVGQLEAIHKWLTRYGYNATVSGNLPLIVNRTNL